MAEGEEKLNVIRIKRKRGEEPLNTLLVDIPAQKRSYIESFQALSTQDKESKTQEPKLFCLLGTVSSHDTPARLRDKIKEAQQKRKLLLRTSLNKEEKLSIQKEAATKHQKEARSKEIKLLRNAQKKESTEYSELFHLVDLVKAEDETPPKNNTTNQSQNKNKTRTKEEESIMCNYMPMVREFLKIGDERNSNHLNNKNKNNNNEINENDDENNEDNVDEIESDLESEGYVYDVYYVDENVIKSEDDIIVARIETFNEDLDSENEYDEDTDSDDEENRVTDIYPDEEEDPEFEDEYGSDSSGYKEDDSSDEYGYEDEDEDDDSGKKRSYW